MTSSISRHPRAYPAHVPPQAMWMLVNVLAVTLEREGGKRPTAAKVAEAIDLGYVARIDVRVVRYACQMNIHDAHGKPRMPLQFKSFCDGARSSVASLEAKDFFTRLGNEFFFLCKAVPNGFWRPFVAAYQAGGGTQPREHEKILNSALEALPQSDEARRALDDLLMTYHGIMRGALSSMRAYCPPCTPYFGVPEPTPPAVSLFAPIQAVYDRVSFEGATPETRFKGVSADEVDPVCARANGLVVYRALGADRYNIRARQFADRLIYRATNKWQRYRALETVRWTYPFLQKHSSDEIASMSRGELESAITCAQLGMQNREASTVHGHGVPN